MRVVSAGLALCAARKKHFWESCRRKFLLDSLVKSQNQSRKNVLFTDVGLEYGPRPWPATSGPVFCYTDFPAGKKHFSDHALSIHYTILRIFTCEILVLFLASRLEKCKS